MSMAKGLLPDTHPQCAGARALDGAQGLRRRDAGRCAPELAAVARQRQDRGAPRSKKFIQIDIEPKEMDTNVEIVAPVVGDIGSCVSALLEGIDGKWPAPPADWIAAVKAKREENVAKLAPRLMKNSAPDGFPCRARSVAHRHQGAARCHPRQRRCQHARSGARRHRHAISRASGSTSAPGA